MGRARRIKPTNRSILQIAQQLVMRAGIGSPTRFLRDRLFMRLTRRRVPAGEARRRSSAVATPQGWKIVAAASTALDSVAYRPEFSVLAKVHRLNMRS
jgi:hypothetical protein